MQAHVRQGALDRAALVGVFFLVGVGHDAVDVEHHLGRCTPSHLRQDVLGAQGDYGVKLGICVRVQGLPISHRLVPLQAGGRERAAFDVFDGFFVHRHQTRARTAFDGHVANGHAAFHGQTAYGRAGKFNRVTRAASGADLADDGQHHVFAGDAFGQDALHLDQHVLGFFCQQGLGGHDVLDLGRTDAVRQRAKRPMRGSVAVAADHGHAGQSGTGLRSDHVHDALALAQEGKECRRTEFRHVAVQRGDLFFADGVGDAVIAQLPARGGGVVVGGGYDRADAPDFATSLTDALKRLRAGDFVHQMAVDVEDGGAVVFGVDDMLVPNLVV